MMITISYSPTETKFWCVGTVKEKKAREDVEERGETGDLWEQGGIWTGEEKLGAEGC